MAIPLNRMAAHWALALAAGPFMLGASMAATDAPAAASSAASTAPTASSDKALVAAVTDALNGALGDDAKKLKISAKKGVVTLSGWINQPDMEAKAREVASKVPGAKKVYSRIRLWSTENSK